MVYNPKSNSYRTVEAGYAATGAAVLDAGLRAYMLRVYNWMASGLVLTGLIAFAIAHTGAMDLLYPMVQTADGQFIHQTSLLAFAVILAPLGLVLVMRFGEDRVSTTAVQALFWSYCALMGASLSVIFLVYTQTSITGVFFITAATFAGTSLVGYTTKMDLTHFGSFLMMGVIGLFIALLVNSFLGSPALDFAISVIGVLVFTGLAAYKTQAIKAGYLQFGTAYGVDMAAKRSVYDALGLYITFVNLFMFLLRLFGQRSSR